MASSKSVTVVGTVAAAHSLADSAPLEAAIVDQLPGWKLVATTNFADAMGGSQYKEAEQGVDMDALRRKFLGTSTDSLSAFSRDSNAPAETIEVFKVEPTNGGPAQVAERRNGKISIVSG